MVNYFADLFFNRKFARKNDRSGYHGKITIIGA